MYKTYSINIQQWIPASLCFIPHFQNQRNCISILKRTVWTNNKHSITGLDLTPTASDAEKKSQCNISFESAHTTTTYLDTNNWTSHAVPEHQWTEPSAIVELRQINVIYCSWWCGSRGLFLTCGEINKSVMCLVHGTSSTFQTLNLTSDSTNYCIIFIHTWAASLRSTTQMGPSLSRSRERLAFLSTW